MLTLKSLNVVHDQGNDSGDLRPTSMFWKFFFDHFSHITNWISIIGSFFMKENLNQQRCANLAN